MPAGAAMDNYTPSRAEMLDAWTAYIARGRGLAGRDQALGEYIRFINAIEQEARP